MRAGVWIVGGTPILSLPPSRGKGKRGWIPAFAGMTSGGGGLGFAGGVGEAGLDEALGVLFVHGGGALDDFEVFFL